MENRALGGHIISFSAQNAPFSRKRPRPDLSGEALRRTVSGLRPLRRPSRRSVRLPHRPVRLPHRPVQLPHRPVQLPHRPARLLRRPAWLPHDPAPSSRRHDCHSSIPVPASSHSCSRVAPAATPFARQSRHGGEEQKKSAFFWSIRKIFTTFTPYCSDNLVSAPQRFARRIRLSSHPGIPMTGDVPAAGSEQHTETTYLSIFNQKHKSMKKFAILLLMSCFALTARSAG